MAKRSRDEMTPLSLDDTSRETIRTAIESVVANWKTPNPFTVELIELIVRSAAAVIMSEQMLVEVKAPVTICGDIHGQLHDLATIFTTAGMPPESRYLFLGDYVDRGKHGIECICVLLGLKVLYPDNIYLLRGNHETAGLTKTYGFYDECKRRFHVRVWKLFIEVFNCLPAAGLVEDAALCMHGGVSKELSSLDQINQLPRPCEVRESGLMCDLLWSDPDPNVERWAENERGVSVTFGTAIVSEMLAKLDIDLIVRAHQVMDNGYSFFAGRSLVTVFSASNYCGEFPNCGAMMHMDAELRCSFTILKPR